jgi:hypothetical protein
MIGSRRKKAMNSIQLLVYIFKVPEAGVGVAVLVTSEGLSPSIEPP